MGFIISPWSLLLMPSGNISFTSEYVTQQDLRAFTAPEVLEGSSLTSVADIEKVQKHLPCEPSVFSISAAMSEAQANTVTDCLACVTTDISYFKKFDHLTARLFLFFFVLLLWVRFLQKNFHV